MPVIYVHGHKNNILGPLNSESQKENTMYKFVKMYDM